MTDEELGRLLSLISHEVRAPLGVMRGYLRMLEQHSTPLPEVHRGAVAGASKAGDRATELLDQLSALARLYKRELRLEQHRVLLEPMFRAALREVVLPREPVITLHVADVPPIAVDGDEPLLRIAIAALVTTLARAQVSDTRIIISAREDISRQPHATFVHIAPATTVAASASEHALDVWRGGVGFDLPVAGYIIDAHGGQVAEHRDESKLVGFTIRLPMQRMV